MYELAGWRLKTAEIWSKKPIMIFDGHYLDCMGFNLTFRSIGRLQTLSERRLFMQPKRHLIDFKGLKEVYQISNYNENGSLQSPYAKKAMWSALSHAASAAYLYCTAKLLTSRYVDISNASHLFHDHLAIRLIESTNTLRILNNYCAHLYRLVY